MTLRYGAMGVLLLLGLLVMGSPAMAEEAQAAASLDSSTVQKMVGLGFAAAFVGALTILGAGYAVARVGSAALGALSEKPELFVRALVFVALAEGLAVLGFAITIMIMKM